MRTETIERLANVSEEQARQEIGEMLPGAEIVSFARRGQMFVATVKTAGGFPFGDESDDSDSGSDSDDAPADDAPADDAGESESDDSDDAGDDSGDSDDAPFGDDEGGDDEGGDEPKEPKLGEVMDLLKRVAEALGVAPDHVDLTDPSEADLVTPDIGAPPAGEPMPPAHDEAPLPAPVPEPKKPGPMGGGAFASLQPKVAGRRSFEATREEAGPLSNKQIIAEAVAGFPGYRVARLNRNEDGTATLAMVAVR